MSTCHVRVFKQRAPRNPRFPWGAEYPECRFMGVGGGWPTWDSAYGNALRHLRDLHATPSPAPSRNATKENET